VGFKEIGFGNENRLCLLSLTYSFTLLCQVCGNFNLETDRLSDEIKRVALTLCCDIAQKEVQYHSYLPYKQLVLFCKLQTL
jgi:hypothetical protein